MNTEEEQETNDEWVEIQHTHEEIQRHQLEAALYELKWIRYHLKDAVSVLFFIAVVSAFTLLAHGCT